MPSLTRRSRRLSFVLLPIPGISSCYYNQTVRLPALAGHFRDKLIETKADKTGNPESFPYLSPLRAAAKIGE